MSLVIVSRAFVAAVVLLLRMKKRSGSERSKVGNPWPLVRVSKGMWHRPA
jgi:hypothetical protein